MKIYEFKDYRKYLKSAISQLPGKGRGELTRMARALDIHTTMMSHIMAGSQDFSMEQSLKLAIYLGFNPLETDYLVSLVQFERAGDPRTKEYCRARVEELRKQALDLKTRLTVTNQLSNEDRAIYYSSPVYAQVRLLTAIPKFQSYEALLLETRMAPKSLRAVLDFLTTRGLCDEAGGKLNYGKVPTYLEAGSPHVFRHHMNWRQKAQEKLPSLRGEDLVFTYPVAMSEEDFQIIREKLVQFIEEFKKLSGPSPSEELYCLNLDWLRITGS